MILLSLGPDGLIVTWPSLIRFFSLAVTLFKLTPKILGESIDGPGIIVLNLDKKKRIIVIKLSSVDVFLFLIYLFKQMY